MNSIPLFLMKTSENLEGIKEEHWSESGQCKGYLTLKSLIEQKNLWLKTIFVILEKKPINQVTFLQRL